MDGDQQAGATPDAAAGERVRGRPSAVDSGRTVLGWVTCEPIRGRTFSKVILMGPYWSGTNAIREEVLWRFRAPVLNPDKLEAHLPTPQAAEALRDSFKSDSGVWEPFRVGKTFVPLGYRLIRPRAGGGAAGQRYSRQGEQPPLPPGPAPPPPPPPGPAPEGEPVVPPPPPGPPPREAERPAEAGPAHAGRQSGDRHRGGGEPRRKGPPPEAAAGGEASSAVAFGPKTDGSCPWWKHAVRQESQGEVDTAEDTLVVLVTKDPLFWLKSMSKHYYEMKASGHSRRAGLDPLFGELQHEGRCYRDAVEFWAAAAGAFLDERLYPSSRCVLLRYEDFLFRFWDVMVHLAAFLPANNQRLKESPSANRSKGHGVEVRGRREALRFYSSLESRHGDFAPEHLERLRSLPQELLEALGYERAGGGEDACGGVCSWVPRLRPGDIVASRFHVSSRLTVPGAAGDVEASGSPCFAWARVVERQEDGDSVALELLREVPRRWLQKDPHDWAVVEWPAKSLRGSPVDLACALEQTVPRDWVDLRMPRPPCAVAALPLTEEGYRAVVSLRSTEDMADFISRVVMDLEVHGARTGRIVDRRGLLGFARWFSGEAMVQSLAQIRRELPLKEAERWVAFAPLKPTRCLPAMPRGAAVEAEAGRVA